MIFRIKRRWYASLIATGLMLLLAWNLGALDRVESDFSTIRGEVFVGLVAALGCLLGNLVIHRMLCAILGQRYERSFHRFAMDVVGRMGRLDALAGGLMAGLGEEPVFRGVLLPALGHPAAGVLGSAVLFGLAHYLRKEYLGYLIWGIGEGIVFGLLFVTTNSIVVPAVTHGLFDAVGFLYFERMRDAGQH